MEVKYQTRPVIVVLFLSLATQCSADRGSCDALTLIQEQVTVTGTDWGALGVESARELIVDAYSPAHLMESERQSPTENATVLESRLKDMAQPERWYGWRHKGHVRHNSTVERRSRPNGDEGLNFFKAAAPKEWIILGVTCVVLCLVDKFFLQLFPKTFMWHLAVIVIWMAVAALYLWGVVARLGRKAGLDWFSGYVLEWMLSMDNLFVFHLVFGSYKTPQNQVHKAVFVGIIGAVVMRMVFFMVVSTLLHAFGWFRWPFGALLVWSGIQAIRGEDDDDTDVQDTFLIRCLKRCLGSRISDSYSKTGADIFVFDSTGRLQVSVLFVVILVIEVCDVVFALDSVSAKVAQIPNQYLAFSSSVLAMYGLRAMFFVVQDLVAMFELLNYGLGLILVFIGVELMFGRWIKLSSGIECIIIVGVFLLCMIASALKLHFWPNAEEEEEEEAEEGKKGAPGQSETESTAAEDGRKQGRHYPDSSDETDTDTSTASPQSHRGASARARLGSDPK